MPLMENLNRHPENVDREDHPSVLQATGDYIEKNPGTWQKYARFDHFTMERANRACAIGFIDLAYPGRTEVQNLMMERLRRVIPGQEVGTSVSRYNDRAGTTSSDVAELFRRAAGG